MKRLILTIIALVLVITSCGVNYRNSEGELLSCRTLGIDTTFQAIFINDSDIPYFVGKKAHMKWTPGGTFYQIDPGKADTLYYEPHELIEYTIIAFLEVGLGDEKKPIVFEKTGLYPMKPIVIKDHDLRGIVMLEVAVVNVGDPTFYEDEYGNEFPLQDHESRFTTIPAGEMKMYTSPIHDPLNEYGTTRWVHIIKKAPKLKLYKGKLIHRKIMLNEHYPKLYNQR